MSILIKACILDGCGRTGGLVRGMCSLHYQRWRKYGDTTSGNSTFDNPDDALKNRTQWVDGCLLWVGAKIPLGYGYISIGGRGKRAHRYAWERENGKIPDGAEIDHKCYNRACVNVAHLRLVTGQQNKSNLAGAKANSQTGVRNVIRRGNRYRVVVQKDKKQHHFGYYSTIEEAQVVAGKARKQMFGEYAGRGQTS